MAPSHPDRPSVEDPADPDPVVRARPIDDAERRARFDRWVVPELDVMYRVAYSVTRSHPDAEDVVQDALLRAFRAIDRFDGRHPRAWLLTIVRNAHLNRIRRRRPELMRDPDRQTEQLVATGEDGRTAEEIVVERGFDPRVEQAYAALPDKFAAVIDLVDVNGLSYQEAADALEIPVGTVMSRLHRARRRIRDRLEAEGLTLHHRTEPTPPDEEAGP